jgi:hypothetical protein
MPASKNRYVSFCDCRVSKIRLVAKSKNIREIRDGENNSCLNTKVMMVRKKIAGNCVLLPMII